MNASVHTIQNAYNPWQITHNATLTATPRSIVPTTTVGGSPELNQLLSNTNTLSASVVSHTTQLEQAQQQAEQQKQLVQQATLLQQQNSIMAQQLVALQQPALSASKTATAIPNNSTITPSNGISSTPASSSINSNASNTTNTTTATSNPRKVAETAESLVGLDSKNNAPPQTQGGKLACAWFVNEVLKKVRHLTN